MMFSKATIIATITATIISRLFLTMIMSGYEFSWPVLSSFLINNLAACSGAILLHPQASYTGFFLHQYYTLQQVKNPIIARNGFS